MFKYIALAFLTVVVICLIYWVCFRGGDHSKRKIAEALLQRSAGGPDANARNALHTLETIDNPNANDLFNRGRIVQFNLLGNRLRGNRAMRNIAGNYAAALRVGGEDAERGHVDATMPFILHNIEEFHEGILRMYAEDDQIVRDLMGLGDALDRWTPPIKQATTEQRKTQAVSNSKTRAEAIDKYFKASVKHTPNLQNVHESKVVKDLAGILSILRESALSGTDPDKFNPEDHIAEARAYIRDVYARDPVVGQRAGSANQTLNRIAERGSIMSFNDSEDMIFAYVWERCDHPRNTKNAALMKDAVVTALADGIENGSPTCSMGRCSRVVNSLVTLDFDPRIADGGVLTFEAYKNQIFQETSKIIDDEIQRAIDSPDTDLVAAGRAYIDGGFASSHAEDKLKQQIKEKIDENLDTYANKLTSNELRGLRDECYVYATI